MGLTTFSEIKEQVLDNWEQLADTQYPEDLLCEFADSTVPIYYGEIVSEWGELSNEDSNRFSEIMSLTPETTIYDLQQADLYLYYSTQFTIAYEQVKEEKAGEK